MMFDLDGSDIRTIREALISYGGDLREIADFHELNGFECPFSVRNSLECVSRVMEKICGTSEDNQQEEKP